jgi:acyl-CoA thioesterase-1
MRVPRELHLAIYGLAALFAAACSDRGGASGGNRAGLPATSTSENDFPVVLFLGTSLTAGLGVAPEEAYPALIQEKIDSLGWPFRVVNAGVSGETTAGGLARMDWLLREPVAVLVLELGANDALRGQNLDSTRHRLQAIIDRTKAAHPGADIVIAGMQAPPNLGAAYTREFREIYPELARSNGAALIPFLLEGVAGIPELNQADGIHPTARGHRIMAENVWKVLEPLLRRRLGR